MQQEGSNMAGELFNGLFNTLVAGIPIWLWLTLFIVLILLFSNAYWWFMFWSPLKPLHGLWYANWGRYDAAMISDINLNLRLVSEKYAKLIFNESVKEAKEGEIDWKEITSGQIGIVGTDIIIDIGKWTNINSEDRYIIQESADKWNIDNPNDQIHSFYKFMKYIEDGKIIVDIKTKETVDWIRIESAFPKTRKTAAYAGYVRQLAEKMDKEEGSKFDSYAIYILIGSIAISALLIISKILLHKPV
jgi:hypothetical protein